MSAAQAPDWLRGDWMQTYTGKAFYPLDPRPEDIDPIDIAHALSMLCRYGGHVSRFYSVAEHCWHLSHAASPEGALWALLHDAAEAYIVDVPRPLKRSAGFEAYRAIEDRLMAVIAERFGLTGPMPEEVRELDTRILLDERAQLMATPPGPWICDTLPPIGIEVFGWDPATAERMWASRLHELTGGAA